MFATQVLPGTLPDHDLQEDNNRISEISETIGYLIAREKKYEVKKGETKIGRDSSMCSIVIEDFTISKVHAVIESEGIDDTFIYDVGSTNQTKLGKKVLKPHCRYKLDNESKLTLGNIIAKFVLLPDSSSNSNVQSKKLNTENLNPLDELGDIFELATQVGTPHITTTKIPVFEKLPESNCAFKISTSELLADAKESPKLSKSTFDEATQCGLDLQKTISKTVIQKNLFESSNIFNLSTQCQLYKSQAEDFKCEEKLDDKGHKNNREGDRIESLLNDGQDDVLCVFMSLHSPKEQNNEELVKKIKTEVKDFCEIFDAPTQMQTITIQESIVKNKIKLMDSSKKDFCNENLGKSNITSAPDICRIKSNQNEISDNSHSSTQHLEEEDFIKTQEFSVENEKSIKVNEDVKNLSQDEETQLYLGETLDDLFIIEPKNNIQDLILTQTFETHESQRNKRTTSIISQSQDSNEIEDFMATQVYDVNKENEFRKEFSTKAKTPSQGLSENLDVKSNLDFVPRNNQDDFIATQVFEGTADLRKNDNKIMEGDTEDERYNSNNEEDFIATQAVDVSVNKTQKSKNAEESRVEKSFRESSPDLMGFENSWKDTEDFITTQLYDVPECQASSIKKSSEKTNLLISSQLNKEKNYCNIVQTEKPVTVESSGDETESDLEIILDKTEREKTGECSQKSLKTESESKSSPPPGNVEMEENDSNSSYIFELESENDVEKIKNKNVDQEQSRDAIMSDSDETDCEEITVVSLRHSVKQELLEKVEFEEAQVLTLTVPGNYQGRTSNDAWMSRGLEESPKFESGIENGSRSPELSNALNVETNNRVLEDESGIVEDFPFPVKIQKAEVGNCKSGREVDSLLKRPLDSKGLDVIPIKKSKTEVLDRFLKSSEKKLLKLVQAHDIAQIQPSRTRNSIKMLTKENKSNKMDASITNEHQSSRRKANPKKDSEKKINGDITSYLTIKEIDTRRTSYKERVKETIPKEKKADQKPVKSSSRILRSSRSCGNAGSSVLNECLTGNIPVRKSRRISRTKGEEYFTSSCVNVVFTGFGCESLDKIISELGGKKACDLSCGEVVVADKVRRTVKFLCAIGLGLPITSPEWLLSCKREQKFLNPWNFILKDEESEEKYNFELKNSLERSKKVKLLEGFSIFATKSTKPPVKELLAIVECCGGTPLHNPPDVWPKKTIIVSCMEDKQWWPLAKFRNIKIVHYEFILGGVLRQKIDFKTYKLR